MKQFVLAALIATGATGNSMNHTAHAAVQGQHAQGEPWFQGSVEQAFAKAKQENKSVFLYWGAVWCPPCNYLKAQVFDSPKFPALMKPSVAVYLDGDNETAQTWGGKFNAEGYPTIILFSSDGKEKMRIDTAMNFDEFENVLTAALAESASMKDIVARAIDGKASAGDWKMITGVYWSNLDESVYPKMQNVADRLKLFDAMPKNMVSDRARLAAGILDSGLSSQGDESLKAIEEAIKVRAGDLFAAVFTDKTAKRSAREMLAYLQNEYIDWLYPEGSPARTSLINSWHQAHADLAEMKDLPVDIHLGTAMGEVYLFKKENKDKPVPEQLKKALRDSVAKADKVSTTEHQRVAAMPSAAYYLTEIGDYDQARALLDKELKTTKVPWYFHSSYSSIEKAAGNDQKALYWAEQARLSAKGRASKIQWIFNEINLVSKIEPKDKDARLEKLVSLYFDTALGFSDGFAGRNARRMTSVAKILKPLQTNSQFAALTKKYSSKCSTTQTADACNKFFAALSAK